MNAFYFTFGRDPEQPYYGGWVRIEAPNRHAACLIFRAYFHPGTSINNSLLNCADVYTEAEFKENSDMATHGNFGNFCWASIELKPEYGENRPDADTSKAAR